MMRIIRGAVVAVALAAGFVSTLAPASADTISRETLSRKFLDYCVNTQFRVQNVDRNSMIEKCRKASASALSGFEGDKFDAPSRSKFTEDQDKAIRAAIATVFAAK